MIGHWMVVWGTCAGTFTETFHGPDGEREARVCAAMAIVREGVTVYLTKIADVLRLPAPVVPPAVWDTDAARPPLALPLCYRCGYQVRDDEMVRDGGRRSHVTCPPRGSTP